MIMHRDPSVCRRGLQRAFTPIELMIVVAIVAILASVAYPAYTDSVLKGRRAQARTALLELMQQQERYMTQTNTYLTFTNVAGVTTPATAATTFKTYVGEPSSPTYYVKADACGSGALNEKACIRLTAMPVRADAAVGELIVDSMGKKECSYPANQKLCWP